MKTSIANSFLSVMIYLFTSSCQIAPTKITNNALAVGLPNALPFSNMKLLILHQVALSYQAIYESVYGVEEVISGYAAEPLSIQIISKLALDAQVMPKQ